jgi:hypothetical protein
MNSPAEHPLILPFSRRCFSYHLDENPYVTDLSEIEIPEQWRQVQVAVYKARKHAALPNNISSYFSLLLRKL